MASTTKSQYDTSETIFDPKWDPELGKDPLLDSDVPIQGYSSLNGSSMFAKDIASSVWSAVKYIAPFGLILAFYTVAFFSSFSLFFIPYVITTAAAVFLIILPIIAAFLAYAGVRILAEHYEDESDSDSLDVSEATWLITYPHYFFTTIGLAVILISCATVGASVIVWIFKDPGETFVFLGYTPPATPFILGNLIFFSVGVCCTTISAYHEFD